MFLNGPAVLWINLLIFVNMQDNLGLQWEGVKIDLGESRTEGREQVLLVPKMTLCHSINNFNAYFRLCHLDISWSWRKNGLSVSGAVLLFYFLQKSSLELLA